MKVKGRYRHESPYVKEYFEQELWKRPPLLSRAADGWPCPRCGKSLSPNGISLYCNSRECRFIHHMLLSVAEAAQVLDVSVRQIENLIELNQLRVRVRIDSIGRVRKVCIDLMGLWRYASRVPNTSRGNT